MPVSSRTTMIVAILLGLGSPPAVAAPWTDVYGKAGQWTVEAWHDGPDIRMCSARVDNPSAQPDFGSFLRLENEGRQWSIVSDYLISGNRADVDVLIDGSPVRLRFALEDDVVRAPVDQSVIDALVAGRRINLNFDPSGQNFSLRGSQAAVDLALECARGGGLQNAGNDGTNEYGGYDIGGTPEAEEDPYGSTRGWTVYSATVAGNFAYCTGVFDDRGSAWRLGWDGMQWQVAVAADAAPDWNGYLEIDGDSRPISGSAKGGWTLLWLGMPELNRIRGGNLMIVDIGRASIEHRLVGTTAVVAKIEECVERKGQGGGAAAASAKPRRAPAANEGPAGCPDDGPRLAFTGICAGRAVAYLSGAGTESQLPDPDCDWVVNEVQIVEDALLYRALRCKGVTAQLEFAGGAQWAQLMVVRSALDAAYGSAVNDPEKPLVWFNTIDPSDVQRQLDMRSRQGLGAELRGRVCAIRRAEPEVSPDGYVFDITPADPKYAQSQEEPTGAQCGPFSYGDWSVRFWRVLGDYAFLFDLSADAYQDIDANSVTLLRKDGSGNWAAVQ